MITPVRSAEQLLHELQVHQIELEMQNEELRRSQLALEESRDRYIDLYEFAPIGYLTLDSDGLISGINLTGALLLGEDRKKVLKRHFERFVASPDSDRYHRLLVQVMAHGEHQTCALALQRKDGSIFHAQLDCVRVALADMPLTVRITLTDITERKQAEAEIESLAFYDPLTKLPNRRLLLDRLQQAVVGSARTLLQGAVLFVDLDDFKALNDTEGHDVGDVLLQQTADKLTTCVREGDTVARLGGDELW
jgi:PAS domain S-box-containing protein